MNKTVAFKKFIEYLNSYNIKYRQDFDEGTVRLTMRYEGMENAPERAVESCIWFHDGSAEARVYYTESASKTIKGSEHLMESGRGCMIHSICIWEDYIKQKMVMTISHTQCLSRMTFMNLRLSKQQTF